MAALHLAFVVLTVIIVLYSDKQGFAWFSGKRKLLAAKSVGVMHALVSVGLGGILLTGGLMFLDRSDYLLSQPVFIAKMAFVLALVINALFIGSISRIATEKTYEELSPSERRRVLISGAVSAIGWIGAGVCGLVLGS